MLHVRIERNIELRLRRSARSCPALVLTGVRQTGKTSTLLQFFPKYPLFHWICPLKLRKPQKNRIAFAALQRRSWSRPLRERSGKHLFLRSFESGSAKLAAWEACSSGAIGRTESIL